MAKKIRTLSLRRLLDGMPPGVTPAMGHFAAEAASVVLEHNGHASGVTMEVVARTNRHYEVTWPPLHKDASRTHNDLAEAAEQGAYGIAFLLAEDITSNKVIERSRKGTGFDYWLGPGEKFPFQNAARMEVSGITNDRNELPVRVRQKMKQTDRSAGTALPAFVAVVEFGQPKSVFKER